MPRIIVLAHNIRSTHNVGAIFRTSDGFGIEKIILSGYTPYPEQSSDARLPHIRRKITEQIHKTALGAEEIIANEYHENPTELIRKYAEEGWRIVALEQSKNSYKLPSYHAPEKVLLILGEEVQGISQEILSLAQDIIEIPMCGQKESFNVSVATGIALYHLSLLG